MGAKRTAPWRWAVRGAAHGTGVCAPRHAVRWCLATRRGCGLSRASREVGWLFAVRRAGGVLGAGEAACGGQYQRISGAASSEAWGAGNCAALGGLGQHLGSQHVHDSAQLQAGTKEQRAPPAGRQQAGGAQRYLSAIRRVAHGRRWGASRVKRAGSQPAGRQRPRVVTQKRHAQGATAHSARSGGGGRLGCGEMVQCRVRGGACARVRGAPSAGVRVGGHVPSLPCDGVQRTPAVRAANAKALQRAPLRHPRRAPRGAMSGDAERLQHRVMQRVAEVAQEQPDRPLACRERRKAHACKGQPME